jgi:hypothetical protein
VAGRIRSIEKSNDLIENRTRDLPACSVVPEPTTLPRAPSKKWSPYFLMGSEDSLNYAQEPEIEPYLH